MRSSRRKKSDDLTLRAKMRRERMWGGRTMRTAAAEIVVGKRVKRR